MWEISNSLQAGAFLAAVALGAALCVLYDLFRLDRMIFRRSTLAVVLEDLVFWLISAFAVFCLLLLTTNGQLRAFILIAVLLGFVCWRLTVSRLVDRLRRPLSKAVRRVRRWYVAGIRRLADFTRFGVSVWHFIKKCVEKRKNCKNSEKN